MTRLLYEGCSTFKPLPRILYFVNQGEKKLGDIIGAIYFKTLQNRISDCRVSLLKRVHSSHY